MSNTKTEALTLDEYRAMVKPEKELCRWCGVQLPMTVLHYPHPDGWAVSGMAGLHWLYVRCAKCDYDWSLWKLGVPR